MESVHVQAEQTLRPPKVVCSFIIKKSFEYSALIRNNFKLSLSAEFVYVIQLVFRSLAFNLYECSMLVFFAGYILRIAAAGHTMHKNNLVPINFLSC